MENQNTCRVCLRLPSKLLPLSTNTDLTEKIFVISSVKILPHDNLPDKICAECMLNVKKFYNFRKVIINSDIELKEKLRFIETAKLDFAASETSDCVIEVVKNEVTCDNKTNEIDSVKISNNSKFLRPNKLKVPNKTKKPSETTVKGIRKTKSVVNETETSDVTIINNAKHLLTNNNENKNNEKRNNISVKLIRYAKRHYKCDLCNFSCKESTKFQNHNRTHHYSKGVCNICGKTLRADNLRKHINMHNAKPVNCEECGKVFKNGESLRSHMFLHKGIEHSCEICGKVYNYKGELTRHMKRQHEGEKPQKKQQCPFCDKAFPYRNGLIRHLQSHTGERPHMCQYCKKGFYSPYALKIHVRQHTNEKPFICEYCPMAFPQKVSLVTHIRSKHNSDVEKI